MPSIEVDYSTVSEKIQSPSESLPQFIPTADGLAILEIQGTLNLPTKITSDHEIISLDDINKLIRFGRIEIEDKKLTLFIGTSQRLVGVVEKIEPPFGLLKFPVLDEDDKLLQSNNQKIEMVNIIDKKVVFKHRPLPSSV